MEVDFGYLGLTHDPIGRRNRKTWLFSARLRHSRLAWRKAIFEQSGRVSFRAHIHAFEYFGEFPVNAILDNLKAAVLKASWRAFRWGCNPYGGPLKVSSCAVRPLQRTQRNLCPV